MNKILTTVQNSTNKDLINKFATVQNLDSKSINSPESGYKKTSLSLKHKEQYFLENKKEQKIKTEEFLKYNEYYRRIETDILLKIKPIDTAILSFKQWKISNIN